jgi:type VI secretion system protein ImpA
MEWIMSTPELMPARQDFAPDLAPYLEMLPEGGGTGVSLRDDALYARIRAARHEDDPSLPMGEWERPLAKADWKAVAALSGDALCTQSKDFQLAAWLLEAWTHLHGLAGFTAGVDLMAELIERFWETAYPRLEEGDAEVRAAPFAWMSRTLARVLSLHVPLLATDLPEWPVLNLDTFARVAAAPAEEGNVGKGALTRELIDTYVTRAENLALLARVRDCAKPACEAWDRLAALVDARLGDDAPSFQPLTQVLMRLARAAASLIGERAVQLPVPRTPHTSEADASDALDGALDAVYREQAALAGEPATHAGPSLHGGTTTSSGGALPPSIAALITDRSHAYRLLADIARYLRAQEPHSPTSYLLDRAISWENMTPADLMRDIVQPDGSVDRYFLMLRIE